MSLSHYLSKSCLGKSYYFHMESCWIGPYVEGTTVQTAFPKWEKKKKKKALHFTIEESLKYMQMMWHKKKKLSEDL